MEPKRPIGRLIAKQALAEVAAKQWGRVSAAQIEELGVDRSTVVKWHRQGYLERRLPRIYAVGHRAGGVEARCAEALLYAGPGAMLSHTTAGWWLGLIDAPPKVTHVTTPRRVGPQPGIRIHGRRPLNRIWHHGLPTTTIAQTLLDLAACVSRRTLRRALANADYQQVLDLAALQPTLDKGGPGSGKLRDALHEHQPKLAHTKSHLEILMFEICERARMPLPEVNLRVGGWEVDMLWRTHRVAVELDGLGNHRSPAQMRRDRRKDMALRAAGLVPLRYSGEQLEFQRGEVIADLRRAGIPMP